MNRCEWVTSDPLYLRYHDEEWGVPVKDDRKLFELFVLEGAQAGLNWLTVLKKRENYREAFYGFDVDKVSAMTERDVIRLKGNEGIIRNERKIRSAIQNAQKVKELQQVYGSFSSYIWGFVGGEVIQNVWKSHKEVPASTLLSDKISKELKRQGFSFVGSTICYSFMQAAGMVNDHIISCFRHKECGELPGTK
ncbi:DNA-3-methyladenine glycosylase 1 [Paenibacillus larvae subsp. larvae]|uniref:DNA-3-methyladenine glycosylase I n=1 Tax=Paenibacillus larvae subsp. larvae TaxID=147375 RepID=A0A2L1TZT8_9BACL|nr:DNA-3-methyladenine glycosylase I [Paenibacillus larvae]AQZ48212.1 DNA-3-methyladenine glycosylase [Paenibacillus larvae subsp. pulvifaciens]AVF26185.1 DNA-3-methyladenine glycosylase 1 [Paenibacillus larvae subsp. larvae]AVF30962.1 DNA-3-methyladenine glycosylase 1 [Paenibacillus larvae subsp. larvae]MBH0341557.1 hypothetical protein [Paenibacillus larvae]MCY7521347.1 DNA-3-methyladenine glycosylase I [Paenibacillus larvae]